ncbi:hypothetical protein DOTSEDRAFT_25956 [Dothistroma septosporum NZE10]|uniref:Heterokaryon incompatibility domain-containing protein n=1 Tax=Dothistroma septosporum (strain NZE10 / CBS 128990) TaxID=675120 RepID=N1PJP9_DOTSN|nr:hypothetical protein DOTSEDRAFT_25956 [Dothistroma septosporum NZE10]
MYQPLSDAKRALRLLTVRAGEGRSDLQCSLRNAQIDGSRPYETVSYCWGHDVRPALLYIDGEALYVPANAQAAIRRLRLPTATRMLWIDSVCINQSDVHERSMQVASMGSIYRGAVGNLVFLGHGTPNQPPDLVDVLHDAAAKVKEARAKLNQADEVALMAGIAPLHWQASELIPPQSFSKLIAIFESPWFRRLWVVQEAALARHSTCFLGPVSFALEDVLLLASVNLKPADYTGSIAASFYAASYMRPFILQEPADGLSTTLRSFRLLVKNMQTTDPRDRIYAVLELFVAGAKLTDIPDLLKPDYQKPKGLVFRDATRYALEEPNSNTLLSSIVHRSNEELMGQDFASWGLRWDRQYQPELEPVQLDWAGAGLQQNAGAHDRRLAIGQAGSLHCLRLQVYIIGTVEWNTSVIERHLLEHDFTLNVIEAVLARAEEVAQEQTFGFHDAMTLSATTLSAGALGDKDYRFQSSQQVGIAFGEYLQYVREHFSVPPSMLIASGAASPSGPERFHRLFGIRAHQRCCFQLDTGHLGIGPGVLQVGDRLVVCKGAEHPYLLRPIDGGYRFVGPAYVSGLMAGQGLRFDLPETWVDVR